MHDQDWHSDLLEVFRKIGLRKGDDAVVMRLCSAHHSLPPPVRDGRLGGFSIRAIEAVEWTRSDVGIKLRTIRCELCLKSIKDLLREPTRIGSRLYHQRWHCGDELQLLPRGSLLAVPNSALQ